jgi:S-formylglutathione hydrolase FrmB
MSATGCGPVSSRLETRVVQSGKLDKSLAFSVLRAPPSSDVDPRTLPVVLFLHGMGSNNLAFDKYGVSDSIYQAMASGEIPRAHLVFPNGERGFYLNWYDGSHPYEDYILQEVMPEAEALLGVSPVVQRHIAGVSMGGIGALQMGLRHPERFTSIACISGVVMTREMANDMMDSVLIRLLVPVERIWGDGTDDAFSDSINPYRLVETESSLPRIFLAFGKEESEKIRHTTSLFHAHLEKRSVPHEMVIYNGEHNWKDWTPVIKQAIRHAIVTWQCQSRRNGE